MCSSDLMLGRVMDGRGAPIDGGPPIVPLRLVDVNGGAINPAARDHPRDFIETGISAIDLLGTGTLCLVWSSPLPDDASSPLRYVDLMRAGKPYLLTGVRNNLGAETSVRYTTSTESYAADRAAGRPWPTKIPFPVHVVERVETRDAVSRNVSTTRYAYHDGHYDGVEREFGGFGMVEQWDTEEIGALAASGANHDPATFLAPVLVRSWFHTGAPGMNRDRKSVV